ncbi:MAG: hypothetical protein OES57_06275 [Acidimicrobiia bacterium]|nr:hypothetical protein [Acidimicrobiia bacterium]
MTTSGTTTNTVVSVRRLLLVLVSVAVLAAACGGSDDGGEATASGPDSAPDFSGTTIEGTELVSADYAGQDVILWFWAPW